MSSKSYLLMDFVWQIDKLSLDWCWAHNPPEWKGSIYPFHIDMSSMTWFVSLKLSLISDFIWSSFRSGDSRRAWGDTRASQPRCCTRSSPPLRRPHQWGRSPTSRRPPLQTIPCRPRTQSTPPSEDLFLLNRTLCLGTCCKGPSTYNVWRAKQGNLISCWIFALYFPWDILWILSMFTVREVA